jgi:hypothetical protein
MGRALSIGIVVATAALVNSTPAAAQPATAPTQPAPAAAPAQPQGQGQEGAPAVKVERGAGGKKVYRITEAITIEGKIQKPEAFYVLQKSGINYEWTELKQDLIPKILDSVSKAPF